MKKICFIIGSLNSTGGTERVTTLMANELSIFYDVSIVSMVSGTEPFFALHANVHTYSLYPQKISFKKNFFSAMRKIRKFVRQHQFDTLIVVDSIYCVFTVPALVGIDINHICWEHFNFNNNNGVKIRDIGRRLAVRYCDYVVTLTNRDEALWRQGIKRIKAEVIAIPNPTSYQDISHKPNLDLKSFLAVGHLTNVKGFDLLIKAWSQFCQSNDDWTLRIVGSGEEEKALKAQAKKLKVDKRIEFIPTTKEIEHYYKTSSFFCLSSRFEGFGMVILEAQSFGLPVISFDCDFGPRDLIENGVDGSLVENGNVEALAERMLSSIALSQTNYEQLSKNAKQSASRFTINSVIQNWIAIV